MRIKLIVVALIISQNLFAGGGWSEKKGNGYFKFGQYTIRAGNFFSPGGDIVPITTVSLYSTSFYAEYGLSDKVTGIAHIPFFVRSTLNEIKFNQSGTTIPGDEVSSFGDPIIGFKYGLFQDKSIVVGSSILFGIPFGNDRGGEGQILQTGDGEFNQLLKLEASKSFYPKPMYATLMTGFNNRTKGFSEEVHYGFELGYTIKDKMLVALKVAGVESLQNGNPTGAASNGIFSNNTEYLGVTPEVSYFLNDRLGLSAAVGFALKGERILAAPAYQFGVYWLKRS